MENIDLSRVHPCPFDHKSNHFLDPGQGIKKFLETITFYIFFDIAERDLIAHQMPYYRGAELCYYFLILFLAGLQAVKLVIDCMADLVEKYLDIRAGKLDIFIKKVV